MSDAPREPEGGAAPPPASGGGPLAGLRIPLALKITFGLGVLVAILVAQHMVRQSNPFTQLQPGAGKIVAVMYFQNLSDPADNDSSAARLTRLLEELLAQRRELHVPPAARVREILLTHGYRGLGEADPVVAVAAANDIGAARMVIGTVARHDSGWVATAQVVETSSGKLTKPVEVRAGLNSTVDSLAGQLAKGVLGSLGLPE